MWLGDWRQVLRGMGSEAEKISHGEKIENLWHYWTWQSCGYKRQEDFIECLLHIKTVLEVSFSFSFDAHIHPAGGASFSSYTRVQRHKVPLSRSHSLRDSFGSKAHMSSLLSGSVEKIQWHQVELGYWKTIKERRKTQKLLFNKMVLSRVIHVPSMPNYHIAR